MKTEESELLKNGIKILKEGGIVIFPTDTAFGIGCRSDSTGSVKRLFEIRRRPLSQAVPVLVNSLEMAQNCFLSPLPNNVRRLIERYWPGALTIVYPCAENRITPLARGNGNTVGIRMPNHQKILALISGTGIPILGPSANFHGLPTPFTENQLDPELVKLVDYVVPGSGKEGKVSTVIDCSIKPWKILRQGAILLPRYSAR